MTEKSCADSLKDRAALAERLLAWFARHARRLLWRYGRTPYPVWVAVVMLQQTRVETVLPYYERFLARFPTVESLAGVPPNLALCSALIANEAPYPFGRSVRSVAFTMISLGGGGGTM